MSSRVKIMCAAKELFYRNGYRATSVDDIIAEAAISKSNFYYHFKSKEDLGVSVLDDRSKDMKEHFGAVLGDTELDPLSRVLRLLMNLAESQRGGRDRCGCPFGNLVAEMGEHSEPLRIRLSELFGQMTHLFHDVLVEGQALGQIRRDVPADEMAVLMVQMIQGMMLLTKCHRSAQAAHCGARVLVRLIQV